MRNQIAILVLTISSISFGQNTVKSACEQKEEVLQQEILKLSAQLEDCFYSEQVRGQMAIEIEVLKKIMLGYIVQMDSLNTLNLEQQRAFEELNGDYQEILKKNIVLMTMLDEARDQLLVGKRDSMNKENYPYVLQPENKIHIDFAQYLEETDEYGVELIFFQNADHIRWYDSIVSTFSEVVYQDELDYSRVKIPDSLISHFFDLSKFKDVKFYDEQNNYCGAGEFQRFEYINQNIEPKAVAVFRLKSENKNALYAVLGLDKILPKPVHRVAPEMRLKELIKTKLPVNYKEHRSLYLATNDNVFYAIQGFEENGFNTYSELFIENNGNLTNVHKNEELWYYCAIYALPIYYNNRPLLLIDYCMSETDWFRSGVLIFKEGKYIKLDTK